MAWMLIIMFRAVERIIEDKRRELPHFRNFGNSKTVNIFKGRRKRRIIMGNIN